MEPPFIGMYVNTRILFLVSKYSIFIEHGGIFIL